MSPRDQPGEAGSHTIEMQGSKSTRTSSSAMSDDDIPVLTKVVRRERRAHLPLTEGLRTDIAGRISARVEELLDAVIDNAADRLRGQLREETKAGLTSLIEQAIEDEVRRRRENPGDELEGSTTSDP